MTVGGVMRSGPWLAALVAGALSTAGCGDAHPAPSYTKVDDMEGGGPFFEWTPPAGTTSGDWFTSADCAHFDRISPPPYILDPNGWSYAVLPEPHETLPGVVSTHAVRFRTTSALMATWGAAVGLQFSHPLGDGGILGPADGGVIVEDGGMCRQAIDGYVPPGSVDLTGYAGVTFWARAESPGARRVRVQVNDANTDPRGGICQDRDSTAADFCYNAFGVEVQLTDTFRQYTLDFATFVQRTGWGYHPPDGIDWSRVYTMTFELSLPPCANTATTMCAGGPPSLSFDIWIDDVHLVKK